MQIDGAAGLVIGGGGGVGGGIAQAVAEAGATVLVADIELDAAERTVERIEAAGGIAGAARVDSTDPDSLDALVARAVDEHGRLDLLVNAVGAITGGSVEASDDDWAWMWELNVMTMVRSVRAALPHLRKGGGHVVLLSSLAGLVALSPRATAGFDTGLYTTVKHAVVGYADVLRQRLADDGIGVTVVVPGLVAGNLSMTSLRNRPERFGGPVDAPDLDEPMPGSMEPIDAGRRVVAAIEAGRGTCFTHPEAFAFVEEAFERRRTDATTS